MVVLFLISVIAVLIAYLGPRYNIKSYLFVAFSLIFIISAIRYEYGNDYHSYKLIFNDVCSTTSSLFDIFKYSDKYSQELGWVVVNYLFKPFGFVPLIMAISLFFSIAYYKFIKRFVAPRWQWLALVVYLFEYSFFPLQLSMMRQGVAIALFVCAIPYIVDRRILPPLILVLLASTFHVSALVLLPVIFIGFLPRKLMFIVPIVLAAVFLLFMLKPDLTTVAFSYMLDNEDVLNYAEHYMAGSEDVTFRLGYFVQLIPYVVFLYFIFKSSTSAEDKILLSIASAALVIMPLGTIVNLAMRVSYYFSIVSIVAIPNAYSRIKGIKLYGLLAIYLVITLYAYYNFFNNPVYINYYLHFKSLFSAI